MTTSVFDIDAGTRQVRFSPEMLEALFRQSSSCDASLDAYLVSRDGKHWGDVYRLKQGTMYTLGRVSTNDIPIPDDRCSRRHCALYQQGAEWFVRDLGSRNGTRLNGEKIALAMPVKSGDWIRIGKTKLLFTTDLSQAAQDPGDCDSKIESDADSGP